MSALFESDIETLCVEHLQQQGYKYISPEEQERNGFSEVVLHERLRNAIKRLNPNIPADARDYALRQILNIGEPNIAANNQKFHRLFSEGIAIETQQDGEMRGDIVRIVDLDTPTNNDFVVCNQFTVQGEKHNRRPDVVLFVNGMPLVVIEIKNPTNLQADLKSAYQQLRNYQTDIPALFHYNGMLVVSDGAQTKAGTVTAEYSRFAEWKESDNQSRIESLVANLLNPEKLIDYLRHFIIFEEQHDGKIDKKMAARHQYRAVNSAVSKTHTAAQSGGDGKIGIVWHAQGSGKSLSMVFYAGKIILELDNPTIVVITDRNDLDEQLFDTFANNKSLLRQKPKQATSRSELQKLLKTSGGGVIFTTLQKFLPEQTGGKFPLLSARRNIVVIADEAHRSHYGFSAKVEMDAKGTPFTGYGFAKHLRDALPNASFIGFTATPVEKEDASTRAVFGDEIDIYDMQASLNDGATVKIYYESRIVKMDLHSDIREKIDDEVDALINSPEEEVFAESAKKEYAKMEAIIGNSKRQEKLAKDIVEHFQKQKDAGGGKAMIVTMSRRIAVELYKHIVALRPEWHNEDIDKGNIKVVMTSTATDPESWQQHNTSKDDRKKLAARLKNPNDSLQIAIVRDMWLTGFDAPCLHVMYVDKPMRGHNLMQAIARVNRVDGKDKTGGLIVDYIGIMMDLQKAVSTYTDSGGEGKPLFNQQDAIDKMREEHEIVSQMFADFDYKQFFSTADVANKLTILLDAQEHILNLQDGEKRFYKHVGMLSQSYKLSLPSDPALGLREEIAFFVAVKSRLGKLETEQSNNQSNTATEEAIRQIVDNALVAGKVVDVFESTGLNKPDLSILSDEFLEQIRGMKRQGLAIALLRKLLNDEFRSYERKNLIRARKLSKMLDDIIRKYRNNALQAAEIINELINLAKEVRHWEEQNEAKGLNAEESAFYDALANNDSARDLMGDKQLCTLAHVLVEKVKASATLDWTIRESVRAKMRIMVRDILRKYGYPPDMQKMATDDIIRQAENMAKEWTAS